MLPDKTAKLYAAMKKTANNNDRPPAEISSPGGPVFPPPPETNKIHAPAREEKRDK